MDLKRESNFELMRIISMLMIITGHTLSWGGITKISAPNILNSINLVYAIILVEVNSFILLTGYFQSTSKFKIKKFVKLLLIMYFYKVLITVLGFFLGWFNLSKSEFLWQISPFDFSNYWFVKLYLVLYCLNPFINKMINKFSRKTFKKMLIITFIFCSVLVTLTNQQIFVNSSGYSLVQFIFIYMVGAYLRKYVINCDSKKELYKNKTLLIACLFICISIFILSFITNYSLFNFGRYLMNKGGILYLIGNRIKSVFMNYDNPLVIIGSIGYFIFFALIKVKSKLINILSGAILEVYIIHETVIFRSTLYSWFGLNKLSYVFSYRIFLKVLIIVFCIFLGATLIEYMRRVIFKIIKYIIIKLNLFKKIRLKISNLFTKIDLWMNV